MPDSLKQSLIVKRCTQYRSVHHKQHFRLISAAGTGKYDLLLWPSYMINLCKLQQ